MTLGGSPGVPTEETKQKVRNGLLGHICKEETRQKLKIANLGKRHSKESIKKMKEIHKGQKAYNKGLYDISYYNSKPIICITTGEIFPSKKEVRRLKSISKSVLDRILLGNILEKDKLIYKYYLGEK